MKIKSNQIVRLGLLLLIGVVLLKYRNYIDTKLWNTILLLVILINFIRIFVKYKRKKGLAIVILICCIVIVSTAKYYYPSNIMSHFRDLEYARFYEFRVTKCITNSQEQDGEYISDKGKIDELKGYLKNTKVIRYKPPIIYDYDRKYTLSIKTSLENKRIRIYEEGYMRFDGKYYKIIKNGITEEYLLRFL